MKLIENLCGKHTYLCFLTTVHNFHKFEFDSVIMLMIMMVAVVRK